MTNLLLAFSTDSAMEDDIAMTAIMLMPALLLQKPHAKSKASEHSSYLRDRLSTWREGDIAKLLNEGRAIQRRVCSVKQSTRELSRAKQCASFVEEGNLKAALRLVDNNSKGTLLLDKTLDSGITVKERLHQLYPPSQPASEEAITTRGPNP